MADIERAKPIRTVVIVLAALALIVACAIVGIASLIAFVLT
ncbi:MAG: hypothetical protein AAFY15_05460 [Cyanobacteria bacterium J06648_11]